jgi:hypothetical protein
MQIDATAVLAVLNGVREQVQEHLGQADKIGMQDNRLGRQRHNQLVALFIDVRSARLHR